MSTQDSGDVWIKKHGMTVVRSFLKQLGIDEGSLVHMDQIHGSTVVVVDGLKKPIEQADGLVSKNVDVFLGVNVADCVPVFLYEPKANIVGIVHAGWKGTQRYIARQLVETVQGLGGRAQNMFVAIGPHIGACCYDVSAARAEAFESIFGRDYPIVSQSLGKWYIDLGLANKATLIQSGVLGSHIDAPVACTSCQRDTFFSYRRQGAAAYGEMLGFIGRSH